MRIYKDPEITIESAILHFGNQSKLANFLELNRTAITEWRTKQKITLVPALYAYRIADAYPHLSK
tara:strand:- start:2 stop:196 length:195 start_codon:yes stop_codon:yes gene_type:complete